MNPVSATENVKPNSGYIPKYPCRISGAGEEIRTLDPNLGKVVLYH